MSDAPSWSQGYVTDVLYTENSYRELSPAWLNYVAALQGCRPRPLDRPFTYVELGCGQGRTVAQLAAAYPQASFIGVAFNPAHIDSAQHYAAELGLANVRFIECDFAGLVGDTNVRRRDLPEADFIALHGVYSWVGLAARQAIQRFIFERLKPGGLVYNSYNCLPGWASEAPLRRLLVELSQLQPGNRDARVAQGLARMNELAKIDLGYFARQPTARQALEQYGKRPVNYLAHEMLNADWSLFYSADVAEEMAATKLDFVGSATLPDNHLDLLFPPEGIAVIDSQPDTRLKQLFQDFLLNQGFRRDVFVRGHAHLPAAEIQRHREDQVVAAGRSLAILEPKIKVPRGLATVDPGLLISLDEILSLGTARIGDLARQLVKGGRLEDFMRIQALLTAGHALVPAARLLRYAKRFDGAGALQLSGAANAVLLRQAAERRNDLAKTRPLVSEVLGGTHPIGVVSAIILRALLDGGDLEQVTARARATMDRQGLVLRKDDQPVTIAAAKLTYLRELTGAFIAQELPVLMAAGIVVAAG
jgi:hypothetical protein